MTADDADEVARLCGQLGYPSPAERITERFAHISGSPDDAVLIAVVSDHVVGWLHVGTRRTLENDLMAEILGVVTDESVRSRGVGRSLVAEAERWAANMGCATVRVRSRIARERAHAFYERAGYRRIKTQHVFEKTVEK